MNKSKNNKFDKIKKKTLLKNKIDILFLLNSNK
jgi:hypothetical protein